MQSSELTQYMELEDSCNESTTAKNQLTESFWLINKLILYLPLWTARYPSQRLRPYALSLIVVIITICGVMIKQIMSLIDSISAIYDGQDTQYVLIYIVVELAILASRLLSIYYFWFKFQFPTHTDIASLEPYREIKTMKLYNKILISVFGICFGIHMIGDILYFIKGEIYNDVVKFIRFLLYPIFIGYPLFFTFAVQTVICCKYQSYLRQLLKILKLRKNVSLKDLHIKYEILYTSFDFEYHVSLVRSIECNLLFR
eukprot:339732_1